MFGLLDRAANLTSCKMDPFETGNTSQKTGEHALNILCKLTLCCCVCCSYAMGELRAQQAGENEAAHHHPPQDMALLGLFEFPQCVRGAISREWDYPKSALEVSVYVCFTKTRVSPSFVDAFSNALKQFKQTEAYQVLYRKYFP